MDIPAAVPPGKPLISLVVPCYNEGESFAHLKKELASLADSLSDRYRTELILVDDGSRDSTWEQIMHYAASDSRVRAIALSRNFGQQVAITCGYDMADGDAVISLDADLQDPPETVLLLISKWEEGADIVYAVRTKRQGEKPFKLWTAKGFYGLFSRIASTPAPANSGDFRLMSKRSIEAFRRLRERHRYIRGMVGWLGFKTATVEYERKPRVAGSSKYDAHKLMTLAMDAIVSFSFFPLRLGFYFAFLASAAAAACLLYFLIGHVLFSQPLAPGWSSLLLAITLFGFLILFCLGVIGEYIGRTYEQTCNRPLYLIREMIDGQKGVDASNPDR